MSDPVDSHPSLVQLYAVAAGREMSALIYREGESTFIMAERGVKSYLQVFCLSHRSENCILLRHSLRRTQNTQS